MWLASQGIGLTGSANAWMAFAAMVTMMFLIIGIGWRIVSNFTRLTDSVERLNRNIETITGQVGGHEHRISMLEGSEQTRSIGERPAAVIYPIAKSD